MAVAIRLKRLGKKKKPVYRLVVADQRNPRDGATIEEVGFYDPLQDQLVQDELEKKKLQQEEEDEKQRQRRREQWAINNTLEELLGEGNIPELIDPAAEAMALALTSRVLPNNYYSPLFGGEYLEKVILEGGDIQDNAKARRSNLAQQLLHQQMVDSQYESSQQETK